MKPLQQLIQPDRTLLISFMSKPILQKYGYSPCSNLYKFELYGTIGSCRCKKVSRPVLAKTFLKKKKAMNQPTPTTTEP